MIQSFRDKRAESIFHRRWIRGISREDQKMIFRKLIMIDSAEKINALRMPPSNRLEKLKGNRQGQYSIRVNIRLRICFRWEGQNAHDIEVVDYH
ncbi:type II toxin-antitoxin system RelE/ParE family toxin [Candidatus Acetothermia bacterium]|nr:type II toxin-antitoxin system RelE/ParE family toxin [Candidatus Acetothermia bacterium]